MEWPAQKLSRPLSEVAISAPGPDWQGQRQWGNPCRVEWKGRLVLSLFTRLAIGNGYFSSSMRRLKGTPTRIVTSGWSYNRKHCFKVVVKNDDVMFTLYVGMEEGRRDTVWKGGEAICIFDQQKTNSSGLLRNHFTVEFLEDFQVPSAKVLSCTNIICTHMTSIHTLRM